MTRYTKTISNSLLKRNAPCNMSTPLCLHAICIPYNSQEFLQVYSYTYSAFQRSLRFTPVKSGMHLFSNYFSRSTSLSDILLLGKDEHSRIYCGAGADLIFQKRIKICTYFSQLSQIKSIMTIGYMSSS